MNVARVAAITRLELLQRVRSVAWYVLLGVFAVVLLLVTVLAHLAFGGGDDVGAGIHSTIVYITLLLVVLVSPTLSGNSINGDRDAATLAPVQVTLATTAEILTGKFFAAWITGLAFAVVSAPFLLVATFAGGVEAAAVMVSLAVLVTEIAVIAAIGVALSGILARPLFSVATTYLVVAALVVGTLITFGLVGASIRTEVMHSYRTTDYSTGDTVECGEWESDSYEQPRFDTVWWVLAANPFVILADATPTTLTRDGYPADIFGNVKLWVRSAQIPPDTDQRWDDCAPGSSDQTPEPAEIFASTAPSWFVGLAVQLLLTAGLLWWAWARTRTPARKLPPGTRIA